MKDEAELPAPARAATRERCQPVPVGWSLLAQNGGARAAAVTDMQRYRHMPICAHICTDSHMASHALSREGARKGQFRSL